MGDFEEHFIQGQEIEVGNDDDGFQGSWYAAKVAQTPLRPNTKLLVQYMTLMDDVESSKPLEEYVDTFIVRPRPPQEEERFFEQGELVEAYHNDGWWEGTITQVHNNLKYSVRLRAMVEEIEFQQSEIRRHHQWIGGRWVGDQELQTIDSSFYVGASVEVCVDDENYRDAWFPAVILNRINNRSFLVEYQTSRFQNMIETVDWLHIRPFPPNTSQDKSFDLLEKVDAFYDCGWWSGVINRVLAGSKYIVFCKYRHEQKEFSHSELRFHMDWIDGKWFQNSKEISPQGQIEAPGQVKSGEVGKTDRNIEMASRCGEDAVKNVAIEKSSGQVQSGDAGKTGQNVDMGSQYIHMAVASSGNSAKTVVAKKSTSFRNSDKMNSASYTINSCNTPKMQSTSEGDADSIITREKRKSMQSTPENVTKSIITREKRKKMQSTPEAVKTPSAPIACRGRAIVLTETDGQLDFVTQTTKGQGANVGAASSSSGGRRGVQEGGGGGGRRGVQGEGEGGVQGEGEVQEGGGGGGRGVPKLNKKLNWVPPLESGVIKLCIQHAKCVRLTLGLDSTSYHDLLVGVHGLYLEPPGSGGCPLTFELFDITKVPPDLQDSALQHWFSVHNRTMDSGTIERKSKELWKHEYNKISDQDLDCDWSQLDYMRFTLDWFLHLRTDLVRALRSSIDNVTKEFDVPRFVYCMEFAGFGKPAVTAWRDFTQKGRQILKEIFFYATYTDPHYYMNPTDPTTYNVRKPIYIASAGEAM